MPSMTRKAPLQAERRGNSGSDEVVDDDDYGDTDEHNLHAQRKSQPPGQFRGMAQQDEDPRSGQALRGHADQSEP